MQVSEFQVVCTVFGVALIIDGVRKVRARRVEVRRWGESRETSARNALVGPRAVGMGLWNIVVGVALIVWGNI